MPNVQVSGEAPPPFRCGLHHPGHDVHRVQAEGAMSDHDAPMLEVTLIEVRDDGVVVMELDGKRLELWNHNPARLAWLARSARGEVAYHPGWALLGVVRRAPSGEIEGYHQFCVVEADSPDRRGCPEPGETNGDDSGAFTISLGGLGD